MRKQFLFNESLVPEQTLIMLFHFKFIMNHESLCDLDKCVDSAESIFTGIVHEYVIQKLGFRGFVFKTQ